MSRYAPRPGTQTEKAFNYVCSRPTGAIVEEIAEKTGTKRNSVAGLLAPAVEAGALTTCKVERPGKPATTLYREGSGKPGLAQQPEYQPPRAVRRETRNAAARFPAPEAPPPKAAAPADQPAPASAESASPPSTTPAVAASARPSAASAPAAPAASKKPALLNGVPELAINQSGAVTMSFGDGAVIDLTPVQTFALGTFLSRTEPLWRSAQ